MNDEKVFCVHRSKDKTTGDTDFFNFGSTGMMFSKPEGLESKARIAFGLWSRPQNGQGGPEIASLQTCSGEKIRGSFPHTHTSVSSNQHNLKAGTPKPTRQNVSRDPSRRNSTRDLG